MSSSSSMWLNKIAWIGEYMWCDKEQDEDEYLSIYDDECDKVLENDKNQNLYVIAFFIFIFEHQIFVKNSPNATKFQSRNNDQTKSIFIDSSSMTL